MLNDLNESLKQLLTRRGGLDASEVDISFEVPTQEWSAPVTRPTVNLYLYDIRENLKLREMSWSAEPKPVGGRLKSRRAPMRVNLSYMVTCWTSSIDDQHRLLWHVLEVLFRHLVLPKEILVGGLREMTHDVQLEVAQPEGVFANLGDFWNSLGNKLRPAISLVATVDLDLDQQKLTPMVFKKQVKVVTREKNDPTPLEAGTAP